MYNIEKLNSDNFQAWKYRIKMVLMAKGLWEYVDGTSSPPVIPQLTNEPNNKELVDAAIASHAAWTKQDNMARAQIGLTVSNEEIIHIEGAATAKEAWTKICGVYEAKGLASIVYLRQKLLSIRKSEAETMQNISITLRR